MGKIIRNGINYGGTYEDATSVNYDNSNSGLNAHTIQEGIDEVQNNVDALNESLTRNHTLNANMVQLENNVDYVCPCDGYFRLAAPSKQGSVLIGYVDGLIIIRLVSSGVSGNNDINAIMVKKGVRIRYSCTDSTDAGGKFIPYR